MPDDRHPRRRCLSRLQPRHRQTHLEPLTRPRRRLQDLDQIATRVHSHWDKDTKALPQTLTEFTNGDTSGLTANDPFTQQAHTYSPLTPPTYQLCAVFLTASVPTPQRPAWAHAAGESCIELDAS